VTLKRATHLLRIRVLLGGLKSPIDKLIWQLLDVTGFQHVDLFCDVQS